MAGPWPIGPADGQSQFNNSLRPAWDSYRQALRIYQETLKATEGGTARMTDAINAWQREINKLVAKGRSAEDIFKIVGGSPVWMENAFAHRVCSAYKELAEQRQAELTRLLAPRMDDILEWLDSLDPSAGGGGSLATEGSRQQIAAARAVLEGLGAKLEKLGIG